MTSWPLSSPVPSWRRPSPDTRATSNDTAAIPVVAAVTRTWAASDESNVTDTSGASGDAHLVLKAMALVSVRPEPARIE